MKNNLLYFLSIAFFGLVSAKVANGNDWPLKEAQECTRHLPTMERLYNIPAHWLAAIASTESGRSSDLLGNLYVPWPWVAKVNGKFHWYDSKQEAVAAVQTYLEAGIKDMGL